MIDFIRAARHVLRRSDTPSVPKDANATKTVVITGVSRGIGKALAVKFLTEGWCVFGTSTSGTTSIHHPNLETYRLNLEDPKSIDSCATHIIHTKRKITLLINNAGVNVSSHTEFKNKSLSVQILRKTLEINLIGLIDLTEKLLPYVKDGGHIINLSSGVGSLTHYKDVWIPSYQISKTSVNMYTRILAHRIKKRKIIVSSVDPGWVRTAAGGPDAPKTPEQAARELFVFTTKKVASGYFWANGKRRAW